MKRQAQHRGWFPNEWDQPRCDLAILETSLDRTTSDQIFKVQIVVLIEEAFQVTLLLFFVHVVLVFVHQLLGGCLSWDLLKLLQLMFMLISLFALETEIESVSLGEISCASLADVY